MKPRRRKGCHAVLPAVNRRIGPGLPRSFKKGAILAPQTGGDGPSGRSGGGRTSRSSGNPGLDSARGKAYNAAKQEPSGRSEQMKRLRIEVCVLLGTATLLAIAFALPSGRAQFGDVHDAVRSMTPALETEHSSPR